MSLPTSQHETDQAEARQEQSLTLPRGPGINTSIQTLNLRNYSLDGPSHAPEDHQSPSASRGMGANHPEDDIHSHPPTHQSSSENESSEQALASPQTSSSETTPTWVSGPIQVPPGSPTDGISSQPPCSPTTSDPWYRYTSGEAVANYRAIGAQYQAWIADTSTTACPFRPSRLTWETVVNHPLEEYRFEVCRNEFRSVPEEVGSVESVGLSMVNNWRYVFLRRYESWDINHGQGCTIYQHRTALGAIFAENIIRKFGPYWSQIAQAQYGYDNHIDTLRYVYVCNVQNLWTWPYVECCLYPRHILHWYNDYQPQRWGYGTQEYQELLGTKLGRGVARLVLGAWPRGTHRIEAINTWTFIGNLQMRFDIVPI